MLILLIIGIYITGVFVMTRCLLRKRYSINKHLGNRDFQDSIIIGWFWLPILILMGLRFLVLPTNYKRDVKAKKRAESEAQLRAEMEKETARIERDAKAVGLGEYLFLDVYKDAFKTHQPSRPEKDIGDLEDRRRKEREEKIGIIWDQQQKRHKDG